MGQLAPKASPFRDGLRIDVLAMLASHCQEY